MNYFVTAIGTDSGKTVVSSILVEMLQADYWKPVQAGTPTDTETVKKLVSNDLSFFHRERHLLKMPASPHAAAKAENLAIHLDDFHLPKTENNLIIEGAGGVFVPLNDQHFMIDLIGKMDCEVILVADLYLGSINHTLLTAEALKNRNIKVRGIVFNGLSNPESERIIKLTTGWDVLMQIPREEKIDREMVRKYAALLKTNWK